MTAYNRIALICPICSKSRMIKFSWQERVFTCGSKACTHIYKFRHFIEQLQAIHKEPIEAAIKRLYVLEQRPSRYVCKQVGINNRTLTKLLRYWDIEPRHGSEAISTQWIDNPKRRQRQAEWFRQVVASQIGPLHPRWRGGKESRSFGWGPIAATIRERDEYKCTRCGKKNETNWKETGKLLCVHHIIPYRLSKDDSSSNLRTLCVSCHQIIENQFKWVL